MKLLTLSILLLTCVFAEAQVKTITVTNPDGTSSKALSLALGKSDTTINSQSSITYPNGMTAEPMVFKKGANRKTYILVANSSDDKVAKFEIDIFFGNKTLSKSTLLIRLSANSFTPKLLGNGKYTFSDKSPAERLKYEFSGIVRLGENDVPISGGWFTAERTGKNILMEYDLTLANGVKTKGQYNMEYQIEDRSKPVASR
ncbi:MAG: hypothetical protein V4687_14975 [Bacteroidota bacterium]